MMTMMDDDDDDKKVVNKCFSIQELVSFLFISPHDIVDYPCQNYFSLGLNGKTLRVVNSNSFYTDRGDSVFIK